MEPIFEKGVDLPSMDEARILLVSFFMIYLPHLLFLQLPTQVKIVFFFSFRLMISNFHLMCRGAYWMLLLGNLARSSVVFLR